jgi:hypothetical protein
MKSACAVALAAAVAGCSGSVTDGIKSGDWFAKPMTIVTRAEGSDAAVNKNFDLAPRTPVGPEDMVGADGSCSAAIVAEAPQAGPQPPAEPPVGSMAGDLAGAPMPAGAPTDVNQSTPLVVGGIALAMSECDVVRRAGTPANVNIGGGDNNERRVVLTYLSGPWPGIYTFTSGRLKDISAAPVQPKSAAKPVAKKKPAAKPRRAQPVQIR